MTEDNLIKIKKPKYNPFVFLCVMEIILFALCLLFGNIKYEVSDDFIMELLLSGTYTGTLDPRLLFSNSIYGCFLTVLYTLVPKVSWYLVIQLFICLLSYIAMIRILCDDLPPLKAIGATALITVFTAFDIYLLPQFTKSAALAVTAGSLLVLHAALKRRDLTELLYGIIVLVLGTMIRYKVIYTALPFLLGYVLYVYFFQSGRIRRGKWKYIAVICAAVMVLGVRYGGQMFDRSVDAYTQFARWNHARSQFTDYINPEYSAIETEAVNAKITENDYAMMNVWQFADADTLGRSQINDLMPSVKDWRKHTHTGLKDLLRTIMNRKVWLYPGAMLCAALGILCLFTGIRKAIIPVLFAFILLGYFLYFASVGRNVYRVECSCFIHAALALAAMYSPSSKKFGTVVLAAALLCSGMLIYRYRPDPEPQGLSTSEYREYINETFYPSWDYDSEKYSKRIRTKELYSSFVQTARNNPASLYILDFNTSIQTLYYSFEPRISTSAQFPKNLFYMGGVTAYHPVMNEYIKGLGYGSVPEALLHENVYYVCNENAELMLTYFHEHGHENVQMNLVKTIDGMDIYSFSE